MRFVRKVGGSLRGAGIEACLEICAMFETQASISLGQFLQFVLECLQEIPHVLIGGLALAEYAKPRATQDLDFVLISQNRDKIVDFFKSKGFVVKSDNLYTKPKRDIVQMQYQNRECDLIFFDSKEFTDSVLKRARPATIFGKKVMVASVEDLVITKLGSMRWKDKADIMAIRSKSDTLDMAYIRDRLWDLGISDRIEFLKLPAEE